MYTKPIAPSGLKKHRTCPFQWADQYVFGNKPPEKNTSNRGIDMHGVLEEFFKGTTAYPSNDRALRPWQPFMEGLNAKPHTAEGKVAVRRDWTKCGFWDEDANYRGVYDLKIEQSRILDIFDWKSGKIYPDHEEQGLSYCAMEDGEYDLYRTHFVYLDIPTHVETRVYAPKRIIDERGSLTQQINVVRTDTEYKPRPGPHCNWCHLSYKKGGKCRAAR